MKTHAASLFLLLAAAVSSFAETKAPAADENTFSPKEKPITTYDKLRAKSPFEFDPPKVQTVEAANPFEGISLAGYCGSGNTLTVYLLAGKEKKKITVFGDGSAYKKRDDSGFRVVGINRGKTLKTTEITLEKDGRQGTVKFDEDTLHAKAAPAGGVQMVRDQNGNMVPRPVIPRPGGAAAQQPGGNYQAPAPFIPGQSNPSTPQQQNPQGMQGGGNPNNITLPNGSLTNQQLTNQLLNGSGNLQPPTPPQNNVVQPQAAPGGNSVPPPSRRRVVLPTQ